MPFRHGKSAAILYNASDLSAYFNSADVNVDVDTAETSTFGSGSKTYVVGLADAKVSAAGLFDGAVAGVDAVLSAVLGADTSDIVTVCPEGNVYGRRAYSMAVKQASYKVSAPVSDAVKISLDLQCDGGAAAAIILAAAQTVTATGNGTSVDNTAGTTNGGVGVLHVTANTRNAAGTFKVQHSVDNSAWVDLITFTSVSASTTASERIVVSGTVNRYVRAQHTIAGATGSTTYSVTFSRR